jgi:hypothetical protein
VAYSASGRDGGLLLVHVAEVSATHATVLICEWRGPGRPAAKNARAGSESGRGLIVISSLSCFFRVYEKGSMRSLLAVVPADPVSREVSRCHVGPIRWLARRSKEERDI